MFRKILLPFFILVFSFIPLGRRLSVFLNPPQVFSQEAGSQEFNKAYQEYQTRLEEYQKAHDDYILARSQYLKFLTLTSKQNAQVATSIMLKARDAVVVSYLKTLVARMNEIEGIPAENRQTVMDKLNAEIAWFEDHKNNISASDSLDTLTSKSDEAKKRYTELNILAHTALFTISDGRINDYQKRHSEIFQRTKDKFEQIKNEKREDYTLSDRKKEIIERWISEAEARAAKSEESQADAQKSLNLGVNIQTYTIAISKLDTSQEYLKEATLFVKEIIREITVSE